MIALLALLFSLAILYFGSKNVSGSWSDGYIGPTEKMGIVNPSYDNFYQNYVVASRIPVIPTYKFNLFPPTDKTKILPGDWNIRVAGQCVNWARYISGVSFSGNAITWNRYINSDTPHVGDIIVMNINKYLGHVGVVIAYDNDTVTIRSRNFRGLWIVSDDQFDRDDVRIVGYIRI